MVFGPLLIGSRREILSMFQSRSPRRNLHRFRPNLAMPGAGAMVLESLWLLSAGSIAGDLARHPAVHVGHPAAGASQRAHAPNPNRRIPPAQEIITQYKEFLQAFRAVEESYVESINEGSTGMVPVSATVTAPYAAGSPVILVNNAAVFGPSGTFNPAVTATATVGSVTIGQLLLTGSAGNQLIVNPSAFPAIPLNPGTVLSATVPVSAQSSAAAIFPSYITASTTQLAVKLVRYFNTLPFKLPRKFAFPHQDPEAGALQQFVFQQVAGGGTSLQRVLTGLTLPTTPGPDLQIYDAAVNTAVQSSLLQVLDGVNQIFAGKFQVVPPNLKNPNGTTTSTGTAGSTSSAGGTGSGTA
jgi:hypothetical protein